MDDTLLKKAPAPPDFSDARWHLVKTWSAHVESSDPKAMEDRECAESDTKSPSWVGYVREFQMGESGQGREYNFFGKEIRLKYWGLKGETRPGKRGQPVPFYGWFAFLRADGKWEVFSHESYSAGLEAELSKGTDTKRVIAAKLKIYRVERGESKKLIELTVKR